MSTMSGFKREDINKDNSIFSQVRTTIETPFYGNNVSKVGSVKEAYKLAKASLTVTVVTDMEVTILRQ